MVHDSVTKLGNEILEKAENIFGAKDIGSASFLKFRFYNSKYPFLHFDELNNTYCIYLNFQTINSEDELRRAHFQISHEVIHLLAPSPPLAPTVFEEGLATFFSITHMEDIKEHEFVKDNVADMKKKNQDYYDALQKVKCVDNLIPKVALIRRLYPGIKISRFSEEHFLKLTCDKFLIKELSKKFKQHESN